MVKAAASQRTAVCSRPVSLPHRLVASENAYASGIRTPPQVREPALPFEVVPGKAGDHPSIAQFLLSVFHGPSASEFQAQIDAPCYRAHDRLLVKRSTDIIAHARLVRREIQFGRQLLPAARIFDFAVLHEYRDQGCGGLLLQAAERRLREDGCVLATLRTRHPGFPLRRGWCLATSPTYSCARTSEILAGLRERQSAPRLPLGTPESPLNIRLWRQVELAGLTRLYSTNTLDSVGPLARDEAYWRWLIDRRAHDCVYVALDGPDRPELDVASNAIVGYAVMRRGRILELMAENDSERVIAELLHRACADAMEHDIHHVRIDAPAHSRVHAMVRAAQGGQGDAETAGGDLLLHRILDLPRFLQQLAPLLHQRALAANLPLPCDLGLHAGDVRCAISLQREGALVRTEKLGRSYLSGALPELAQLALGQLDLVSALQSRRLVTSTRIATEIAAALFPRQQIWHPPWDDEYAN